jgi:alpha-tubulin suppressor-like RCC1 family protein
VILVGAAGMNQQLENVVFSCGSYHTGALTTEGKVLCWGFNGQGQCDVPPTLEHAIAVSCGNIHSAAITK